MAILRRSLALALLLLVTATGWAEVKIAKGNRVRNRPPGRCGWCALETLARHHHAEAFFTLVENHPSTCAVNNLEEALKEAGVPYRIQYPDTADPAILRKAVDDGLGAVVGFRELYPGAGGHIVTLIDITDDAVKVIDCNDHDCRTRVMTRERFLFWWDGFALVPEFKPAATRIVATTPPTPPKPPAPK